MQNGTFMNIFVAFIAKMRVYLLPAHKSISYVKHKGRTMTHDTQTSLDKALSLLDILCKEGKASIKSLSRLSGLPAPTVHRLLAVLARNNFVRHDPVSREYALAVKFLEFGARVRGDLPLASLAMPAMRELMEISGETVNLVVFEHDEAIYVEQVVNPRAMLLMFTRIGARIPLYCSGVGKAYLAAQPPDFATAYLSRVQPLQRTCHTIVDEAALHDELQHIRRMGYAIDHEEMEYGVRCAAALIRQSQDVILGALSVSGPIARVTSENADRLGLQVRRAAEEISRGLGYYHA